MSSRRSPTDTSTMATNVIAEHIEQLTAYFQFTCREIMFDEDNDDDDDDGVFLISETDGMMLCFITITTHTR